MKQHQNCLIMIYKADQIQAAVASICPEIRRRVECTVPAVSERALWWDLSTCILSSQVPYPLAAAVADVLDRSELLLTQKTHTRREEHIFEILSEPVNVQGRLRKYRFPSAKAAQLAMTHRRIHKTCNSLAELLDDFRTAEDARKWLVNNAPGLGPKQASMFLRNVGLSYDLAILDRHVLEYMELLGLSSVHSRSVQSISGYIDTEVVLRAHARESDCPVGILDWAIWIVMRVVKQPKEKLI